jgi:hypothetical protein
MNTSNFSKDNVLMTGLLVITLAMTAVGGIGEQLGSNQQVAQASAAATQKA